MSLRSGEFVPRFSLNGLLLILRRYLVVFLILHICVLSTVSNHPQNRYEEQQPIVSLSLTVHKIKHPHTHSPIDISLLRCIYLISHHSIYCYCYIRTTHRPTEPRPQPIDRNRPANRPARYIRSHWPVVATTITWPASPV